MILTNYYHRKDKPFQTLSSLSEDEAINIISNLEEKTGTVYRRFSNPQKYWRQRQKTEGWIKQEFIKKGGQPIFPYPQYFVVEQAV